MTASEWSSARGDKWRQQAAGMEATIAPVDEPLIQALRLDAPYRIADIGCGGGATTREILRRAPAGSVVHGYDISASLIELARGSSDARIEFQVADMITAAPPGRLYDRMASRFGIMFFDDASAAFKNLARWLVPGGRFAFAAWGRLSENPWMVTVRDAVAEVVEVPKADPEAPGPFRYADADKLLTLLQQSGFGDLNVTDWHGSLKIGGGLSATDASTFALAGYSIFAELLAAQGESATATAHRILADRFAPHEQNRIVKMDAAVHIFTGALLHVD